MTIQDILANAIGSLVTFGGVIGIITSLAKVDEKYNIISKVKK